MNMRKLLAFLSASALAFSAAGCGGKSGKSSRVKGTSAVTEAEKTTGSSEDGTQTITTEEVTTQPVAKHESPAETVSASVGSQYSIDSVLQRTEGSNTLKVPLADLIEEGDKVRSFTFIIYSGDGSDIGQFKGGCGISVASDCPAAKDKGWYQSADFSAPTEGSYGEITWDVPGEIRDYISDSGEVLFGYWWGNPTEIKVDSVVCTFDRSREVPVDGTASVNVGKSIGHTEPDNTLRIPLSGIIPEKAVPQTVVFNISAPGSLGKFTGAFGIDSPEGYFQSVDTAVFTDSSSLSLTWFVPEKAKYYAASGGELVFGHWWSKQQSVTLDSVTVKYTNGEGTEYTTSGNVTQPVTMPVSTEEYGFRSAKDITDDIKVGWNLGNTLESYDYKSWTTDAETAWGNPRTTKEMFAKVKEAGFNAVRIPVTWSEHMNGDTIEDKWMDRVQEVVDYAYDQDLYVILNMHHDDYIWFRPQEADQGKCSARLIAIWKQICQRFGDYGDRLLFEGMNEPRTVGSSKEWNGGTPEERMIINKYARDFVSTVRASGGKNAERTLVVTTYGASAESAAMNDMIVPDGGNIILSIHYYAPWNFADGKTTEFTKSDEDELNRKFGEMKQKFVDKGIPVIIGEFGCVKAAETSVRARYLEYYVSAAKAAGIKCFLWDNGAFTGESSFGIFRRKQLKWEDELVKAIIRGAE